MSRLSENLRKMLQARITTADEKLSETREWLTKLEAAGFTVTDLQTKQSLQEAELERLRLIL